MAHVWAVLGYYNDRNDKRGQEGPPHLVVWPSEEGAREEFLDPFFEQQEGITWYGRHGEAPGDEPFDHAMYVDFQVFGDDDYFEPATWGEPFELRP